MNKYRVYQTIKIQYAVDVLANDALEAQDIAFEDYDLEEWDEVSVETLSTDVEEVND